MEKGNHRRVRHYFSISLFLYSILGGGVFIVGGSLGPWLIYDVLVIPAESQVSALVVYYFALLSLSLSLVISVSEAVIIAHENMKIYAYLSILEVLMKLGVAYGVMVMSYKLAFYGIAFVVFSFIVPKTILIIYCWRRYKETHPVKIWDKKLLAN